MVKNENSLASFISRAHLSSYASGAKPVIDLNGTKSFNFQEGDWQYLDQYQDQRGFIGFEVIKKKQQIFWGMNYYGQVVDEKIDLELVNSFLRQMLMKNKPGLLLRGPKSYKKKEWHYRYTYQGSLNNFQAKEIIKYKGKIIYICHFHGGLL